MRNGVEKIKSLYSCMEELSTFSKSYQSALGRQTTFNICPNCLEKRNLSMAEGAAALSDLGQCSHCLQISSVYDLDLLKLYRAFGLTTEDIAGNLPVLRQSFLHRPILTENQVLNLLSQHIAYIANRGQKGGKCR